MYIVIAAAVFAAIAILVVAEMVKRHRRKRRYPEHPDGVRKCTTCGTMLAPGATDCSKCGSDTVVIVV